MINLIKNDHIHGFKLYQTDSISQNLIGVCNAAHYKIKEKHEHSTWNYKDYNIFNYTSGDDDFWHLYKDIIQVIRQNVPLHRPAWIQSWLNYYNSEELNSDKGLNWHNHMWDYHGYICVDPKNTITEFENYTVENQVGLIYFGPGHRKHRVQCVDSYEENRITIGFDVTSYLNLEQKQNYYSFIPILD